MRSEVDDQPLETTSYSLSAKTPMPGERRDGGRHLTLYRVGAMLIDGRRELCLIKNISGGGMKIRAYCTMQPGAAVAVELKSGQLIAGKVSWVRDANVGITFDQPIDVVGMLANSTGGPQPRMPRVEADCFAVLREGATTQRLRVHDISQGGIKVETPTLLPCGSDVVVSLPGIAPQAGVVRWCDGGFAGIFFNGPLPLSTLVDWLQEQRSEPPASEQASRG